MGEKVRIRLDDEHTRAVWETVQRARAEVASWPAWKRGDQQEQPMRFPMIRLPRNSSLRLVEAWNHPGKLLLDAVIDKRRNDVPPDDEHWRIASAVLTPAAARKLRDQLDEWLAKGGR